VGSWDVVNLYRLQLVLDPLLPGSGPALLKISGRDRDDWMVYVTVMVWVLWEDWWKLILRNVVPYTSSFEVLVARFQKVITCLCSRSAAQQAKEGGRFELVGLDAGINGG
jgi:hypothetical protein